MQLTKVKVDEDGGDIGSLDLYYDATTEEYKHRFTCPVCGVVTAGCVCYGSLHDAIEGSDNEWYCNCHYVQTLWYDLEIYDLIDVMFGLGIGTTVGQFEDIKNGELYPDETQEFRNKEMDKRMAECNEKINGLSDIQIDKLCGEIDCDCDTTGSACEV